MKKGAKKSQKTTTPDPAVNNQTKSEATAAPNGVQCVCGKGCNLTMVPPDGRRSTNEGRRFRGECGRTFKRSLRAVTSG